MKKMLWIFVGFAVALNALVVTVLLYPVPAVLDGLSPNDTLKIYDRNHRLLYEVLNEKTGRQSFLPLGEIPEDLKNAFLSAEDSRFYEHSGIDARAILRAVWQNVSEGEIVSGGSTITQQVVRNVIGTQKKRTFGQKLKESVLAIKISKLYNKDKLFEFYLNSIYFGGLAYGVESASWQYFNKSARNLDLAETAFVAGLPQAPGRYYPLEHLEAAKKRQQAVLSAMLENGKIDEAAFRQAAEEEIVLRPSSLREKKAPHFVDSVLSRVDRQTNDTSEIITTLDLGLQEQIETILRSDITFLAHLNIESGATVVLSAKTGDVLAMVGSADYQNTAIQGAVNVALSLRQPGSSIKPLVYAAALEKGWSPGTIIEDEPTSFTTADGLPYSPQNFDLAYHGPVTIAEALAQSLNIPAVKTLDFVGIGQFLKTAKSFGITTLNESPDHYGLALALGSGEVKLLELANAYSVLPNHGNRPLIRFLESDVKKAEPVIRPETAAAISAILSSNELRMPAFGDENPLKFSFPAAAKTGTTRNFRDNWTLGYTDDYVVGVWVGNAGGEAMEGVSGISGAGPIFHKIMNLLHESSGTVLTVKNPIRLSDSPPLARAGEEEFRIITPFANDRFKFDPKKPADFQKIKLEASQNAHWFADEKPIGEGKSVLWPLSAGVHRLKAVNGNQEREVVIWVE